MQCTYCRIIYNEFLARRSVVGAHTYITPAVAVWVFHWISLRQRRRIPTRCPGLPWTHHSQLLPPPPPSSSVQPLFHTSRCLFIVAQWRRLRGPPFYDWMKSGAKTIIQLPWPRTNVITIYNTFHLFRKGWTRVWGRDRSGYDTNCEGEQQKQRT